MSGPKRKSCLMLYACTNILACLITIAHSLTLDAVDADAVVARTRSVFSDHPHYSVVFLFGSGAAGAMRSDSDVDIAFAGTEPSTAADRGELQLQLEAALGLKVDLVDLHLVDGLMLRQVLTKGKRLACKDSALLARLMGKMLAFTEDVLPYMTRAMLYRARRLANG